MVYKFRLLSDEVDNFRRDIEIDSEATFHELHKAILDSVNYPDDQMTSFFICNDRWVKELEITLEDMGGMSEDESYVMAETVIGDIIEEEKQKLVYVFDPLGDRMFYMELSKIEFGKDVDQATCTKSAGDAPAQLLYVDADGKAAPLVLGAGLEIVNGVLTITNAQAVRAICGTVLAGQTKCGEV